MAWAAVAVAASAALQAMGSIQQGQASAAAAGYNAKIAQQNAKLATQQAGYEGAIGEQKAGLQGLRTRAEEGTIKTRQGANNIDVNSGSAADVRESVAEMGKFNEANIRSDAARRAYGFETQSTSDTAQAGLDRMEQSADKTAGYLGAGASALKGAGEAAMLSGGGGGGNGGSLLGSGQQTSAWFPWLGDKSVTTGDYAANEGIGGLN